MELGDEEAVTQRHQVEERHRPRCRLVEEEEEECPVGEVEAQQELLGAPLEQEEVLRAEGEPQRPEERGRQVQVRDHPSLRCPLRSRTSVVPVRSRSCGSQVFPERDGHPEVRRRSQFVIES